jgi:hypothetical protein
VFFRATEILSDKAVVAAAKPPTTVEKPGKRN